jgi:hypothetical protein
MKHLTILLILYGLPPGLTAQNTSVRPNAISSQHTQTGWEKVSGPPVLSVGVSAPGDPPSNSKIFPFPRTVAPLADGYTYTSVPAGTYRALSSDIETNPHGVNWTALNGVPTSDGVNWQAIAWALNTAGDVVTEFAKAPNASMVSGCPCGYYRLPKGSTKFVAAAGTPPNGVVGYIVADGKGGLYSETGFGSTIQRSMDGGRSWANAPGPFAVNPYYKLNQAYGGLYGLAIINNMLYTGGEGGILRCDLEMRACTEVAASVAAKYGRDVVAFASNGGPQTAATEIFELARSAPASSADAGSSLLKWDSGANMWYFVPSTPILGAWYDAYINSIYKLSGPHEYLMTRFTSVGSNILYTNDAVNWTRYDTVGLPAFDGSYKSLFLAVNPLSGAQYMVTYRRSLDLYVHKR